MVNIYLIGWRDEGGSCYGGPGFRADPSGLVEFYPSSEPLVPGPGRTVYEALRSLKQRKHDGLFLLEVQADGAWTDSGDFLPRGTGRLLRVGRVGPHLWALAERAAQMYARAAGEHVDLHVEWEQLEEQNGDDCLCLDSTARALWDLADSMVSRLAHLVEERTVSRLYGLWAASCPEDFWGERHGDYAARAFGLAERAREGVERALWGWCAARVECAWKEQRKREVRGMVVGDVLHVSALADALGKQPVERALPNGTTVRQVVWEGSDLVGVARLLHNVSGELPGHVKIDGPAPGWLAAALAHELHPRSVSLNSPDGYVPVGCQRPSGRGAGANLVFEVVPGSGGWTVVRCLQADPSVPLSPADLSQVVPPEVPVGSKVVLSGRMPNWLLASLAMAYHGVAKAVACYQPGVGATVAWTHSPEVQLGSVVDVVRLRVPNAARAAAEAALGAAGEAASRAASWPVLER